MDFTRRSFVALVKTTYASVRRHMMISFKHRWITWAILALVCFIGAVVAFMIFYAAIDLGYDNSSHGTAILSVWGYVLFASIACGVGLCVLASISWWRSRRNIIGPAEKDKV